MLNFLYKTFLGRLILKILTRPSLSKMAGYLMDSRFSSKFIKLFIKKNNISTDDCIIENWKSFNDFFTRRLNPSARIFSSEAEDFLSPCDGLLTTYEISDDLLITVKNSTYSISSLLENPKIAKDYTGGQCLVFRLTPSHYHRYHYFDSGRKGKNTFIKGILHTVLPIAVESEPIYLRNSREYTILKTDNFGDVVFMEVGAMLVGRIVNYHQEHSFSRGDEKGKFEFGGSTIILLLEKNTVNLSEDIITCNSNNLEYPVIAGQKIGKSIF